MGDKLLTSQRAVQIAFHIGWNFFLLILAAPIGYLVRILYAKELPKLEVGLFYAVLDFCCMVAIFKDLGLSAALVSYKIYG